MRPTNNPKQPSPMATNEKKDLNNPTGNMNDRKNQPQAGSTSQPQGSAGRTEKEEEENEQTDRQGAERTQGQEGKDRQNKPEGGATQGGYTQGNH
jgi:hypothetical protein